MSTIIYIGISIAYLLVSYTVWGIVSYLYPEVMTRFRRGKKIAFFVLWTVTWFIYYAVIGAKVLCEETRIKLWRALEDER